MSLVYSERRAEYGLVQGVLKTEPEKYEDKWGGERRGGKGRGGQRRGGEGEMTQEAEV